MTDIRWQQRFDNFQRALNLLLAAFSSKPLDQLNDLEKEGVIQRFEYTFELGWKTIKDYLVYSGIQFSVISPRDVLREAFQARVIADGTVWIAMLDDRNLLSHTYDQAIFERVLGTIHNEYLGPLQDLQKFLQERKAGS